MRILILVLTATLLLSEFVAMGVGDQDPEDKYKVYSLNLLTPAQLANIQLQAIHENKTLVFKSDSLYVEKDQENAEQQTFSLLSAPFSRTADLLLHWMFSSK